MPVSRQKPHVARIFLEYRFLETVFLRTVFLKTAFLSGVGSRSSKIGAFYLKGMSVDRKCQAIHFLPPGNCRNIESDNAEFKKPDLKKVEHARN